MKHWENWTAGVALIFCLLMAWFSGNWLRLGGVDLWILRGGLAALGVCATGAFWWWFHAQRAPKPAGDRASQPAPTERAKDDIDSPIREADSRLRSSPLVRGASIRNLPVFILVGSPGSAKTSVVVQSGLEPELLAGQVFQEDSSVIPTRSLNLWLARQTIFAEAGGKLVSEPEAWARLVRGLAPAKLRSILGKREQAPRAVVVCFDCEELMKPGAAERVTATARNLHTRLREISQLLGISFPVYVLFSKLDRLKFFAEYMRNLSDEEATRVLGVTLPIQSGFSTGVYAEHETKRLTAAFDHLFYALSGGRAELLNREHGAERLPGIYEFPREFRKLRSLVVQFLLDLCRPSQLRKGPFLRGFYFTGVRAVVASPRAPAVARRQAAVATAFGDVGATRVVDVDKMQADSAFERFTPPDATRVFDAAKFQSNLRLEATAAAPRVAETRPAEQWVFLSHLFGDALLEDRTALGTSGSSAKINFWQRLLLASAAALFLICTIGFVGSYVANRGLESELKSAAERIPKFELAAGQLAPVDALRSLDTVRMSLERIRRFERDGAPLHMRWGLYSGTRIYPYACTIYFGCFRRLLLGQTQEALLRRLKELPDTSGPHTDDADIYGILRAYLMTTSHPERSDAGFLAPALLETWKSKREPAEEQITLVPAQFTFYADELRVTNCFQSSVDNDAVARARRYLARFGATESVYQAMLGEASKRFPQVSFRDPAGAVRDDRILAGAFTKDGWTYMQDAIKQHRFPRGEDWVLGQQAAGASDPVKLEQELRARYLAQFIEHWRQFLKSARVASFANAKDAALKLSFLAGNQSPLLALFCVVSQNTSVEAAEVRDALDPVHKVEPSPCRDLYIQPPNAGYMSALANLQLSTKQYADSLPTANDAAASQVQSNTTAARQATVQIAQGFKIDHEAGIQSTVQELLERPISEVERLIRSHGPDQLNAQGRMFCSQFRELMSRFPFYPSPTAQAATPEDLNRVFKPHDGALWVFYDASLKALLPRLGSQYAAQSGGSMTLTHDFVGFFKRAAALSEAFYQGGSGVPHLEFSLQPIPMQGVDSLTLTIDGQSLKYPGSRSPTRFIWPGGSPQGVNLNVKVGGAPISANEQGLWGVFKFFASANWESNGTGANLEWEVRSQVAFGRDAVKSQGPPAKVRLYLDAGTATDVFRPSYLSSIRCVSKVAR